MKLLNPNNHNETVGGSLYWNSDLGMCYGYDSENKKYASIECDFTNIGLNETVQQNIEIVNWNLGGFRFTEYFVSKLYEYEREKNVYQVGSQTKYNDTIIKSTIWSGRIALAYPSDYGYAVDLGNCRYEFWEYRNCTLVNWMYPIITNNGSSWGWLLTPNSSNADLVLAVHPSGAGSSYGIYDATESVPVIYLDSELVIKSGTGKKQ